MKVCDLGLVRVYPLWDRLSMALPKVDVVCKQLGGCLECPGRAPM